MTFFFNFDIDKNVIKIHNNKNIKFFCKDLINIALESCQNIDQPKKHYLIFEITISNLKSYFLFISFPNSYLMIDTYEIILGKPSSLLQ